MFPCCGSGQDLASCYICLLRTWPPVYVPAVTSLAICRAPCRCWSELCSRAMCPVCHSCKSGCGMRPAVCSLHCCLPPTRPRTCRPSPTSLFLTLLPRWDNIQFEPSLFITMDDAEEDDCMTLLVLYMMTVTTLACLGSWMDCCCWCLGWQFCGRGSWWCWTVKGTVCFLWMLHDYRVHSLPRLW